MKLKKKLFDYIETITTWSIEANDMKLTLPLHIKLRYVLWFATIAHQKVVFVKGEESNIRNYYKTVSMIEELSSFPVILVFEHLKTYDKERLVKKHISFVVVEQYIYIPFAFMKIDTKKTTQALKKAKELTPLASAILLGYLVKKIASSLMISEIAIIVNQGLREVSSALTLLEEHRFIRVQKKGRKKIVFFEYREEILDEFISKQRSPIKANFFTNSPIKEDMLYSSFTALTRHSTLVDNEIKTIAIHTKKKKLLASLEPCFEEEATYQVEIWNNDPYLFSTENTVSPLYLLQLFKDNEDERIAYALNEIRKKIKDTN
jgi:hypothetical protein